MSKRVIAVDLDGDVVRVARVQMASGKFAVTVNEYPAVTTEEVNDLLQTVLKDKSALTDRVVTALSARVGLYRQVRFPFHDRRKIDAALPLAFSSSLPVSLENQLLASLPAQKVDDHTEYSVDAVAVDRRQVEQVLACFPEPLQDPGRIDLYPFALAPAMPDAEGILVLCRQQEIVVALVAGGRIRDYRFLPVSAQLADEEIKQFALKQINQLEHGCGFDALPLWVLGSRIPKDLPQQLEDAGRRLNNPLQGICETEVAAAMLPAVLLAVAEWRGRQKRASLDFRRGEYAARGQWDILRPKLVVATLLLVLIGVGSGVAMHMNYQQKSAEQAQLSRQMRQLFEEVMPAGSVVVDVPMQLESYRRQLQQQVQLFGLDGRGATAVLQELSATIDEDLRVELQDFNYTADEVRISGFTSSFDAVNQIAEALAARPLFATATIANARLATDNVRVDFELRLELATKGQP
mgnify:CR=1 FL=1